MKASSIMAKNDSTQAAHIKWMQENTLPRDGVLFFVSRVKEVCDGVGAVLALNYEHEGERLAEDKTHAVGPLHMESLMTLARASLDLLERDAASMKRWADTHHSNAGIIDAYHDAKRNLEHRGLTA